MFQKVDDSRFIEGEHEVLRLWQDRNVFRRLMQQNAGGPKWSFLDGPITANNPMGVHHAWGRTYKDAYQRYFAMTGHELRYQNGFDCQGLWVEVEVEKELKLGTKTAIIEHGIDKFVHACKKRVLKFAARQTEQSIRLGYWMEWDDPAELRKLSEHIGQEKSLTLKTPKGVVAQGTAEELTARLGNPQWGGSYFTFSTENNETIWTFLKKCFERKKIYMGHDVMPWSGRGGSAYSQMEVADGRKLTTHKSCFVRFPLLDRDNEYLLVWTTTPWTLTSNVACMVNPDLDYVKLQAKKDGAIYYFAKENLEYKRLEKEFKEGFGRPEWQWPEGVGKLKTISQIFKEQGGYEILDTIKGADMIGWRYKGPFDELEAVPSALPESLWTSRLKKIQYTTQQLVLGQKDVVSIQSQEDLRDLKYLSEVDFPESIKWKIKASENYKWFFNSVYQLFENLGVPYDWNGRDENRFTYTWTRLKNLDIDCWLTRLFLSDCTNLDLILDKDAYQEFVTRQVSLFSEIEAGLLELPNRNAVRSHRVVAPGKDSKGSDTVVAGEGTGIVHTAPGCGDIDHKIGVELGLPIIAPLKEDGTYGEGFGPFTGKEAISPQTADLVFDSLKQKGYLVYVETYPHIYPHCWRTGDELVFRLVDEWFINMDWRDEIKAVVDTINWLPDSIQGREREKEWLTTMRDWMISKKRFWGLALPIWVNPHDPSDFEVIGSLEELKSRAVEGWDEFEGHTPHRPWIDKVKIKSQKTGAILTRIEDVGNPWLDAGIVPFSTMHYNHDKDSWKQWFPADLVTECFPGQFRNWFYSMLSLATMMRYDETDNPEEKKPFKNLLGHRLVMNEQGKPMHKSDGTAIWFEEAAEQLGVDTLRWLYLAQNPASDLRFGTRHPDQPVTLQTVDGPISQTKEGLSTCRVTSTPADDIRRMVLIPLWNSYAFFVNYAVLDGFDPTLEQVPLKDRPEIDRWVLSRLQELIATAHESFQAFDVSRFMQAAQGYIDDLSNWYIRRNRRRFWKPVSGDSAGAKWDTDKLAAYQTLHEVLVTLSKLLAPCIPFLTERMYQNLVEGADSVHLCRYPEVDSTKLDPDLNWATHQVQELVTLGHRLRETAEQRVRQPLAELRFACRDEKQAAALLQYADIIGDELNVKKVVRAENLDDLVSYAYKPNLKTLGPKYGKILKAIGTALPTMDPAVLAPLRSGATISVTIDGNEVTLEPNDVMVSVQQASDWASADSSGIQVALSTRLTPELIHEGMARDLVRHIQQLRKDANLEENDRIHIGWFADKGKEEIDSMLAKWGSMVQSETRADSIEMSPAAETGSREVAVGDVKLSLWLKK